MWLLFGGGGYFIVGREAHEHLARPTNTRRMVAVSVVARGEHIEGGLHILLQARPMRPSDGWFNRLRRQPHVRPRDGQTLE